ncbi:MAG: hypothetical protein H8E14_06610 [Candidatus Marinimicrobia bacterium]|nr:hypothetical protein [Candidatus Neomarinimicrobiota bacterium]
MIACHFIALVVIIRQILHYFRFHCTPYNTRINEGRFFHLLLLGTFSFGSISSQDIGRLDDFSRFTSDEYSAIVASIDNLDITAREFLFNYEFGPAFFKRQQDSRERYLNIMIYEKLLALDGYARGLNSSPLVQRTLKEIEGDLITEELYKDDVMSRVSISEQEIEEGIRKNRDHISIKWLFSKTEEEIINQKRLLDNSTPFDSLFAIQINDSVTIDDRFLETTRFRLRLNNPDLSVIVDSLTLGMISDPIEVDLDGWYIFKIVDNWVNPITTETEWMKERYDTDRAIYKQKLDYLSDQYVDNIMLAEDPIIVRTTFNILQAFIGKSVLSSEKYSTWDLTKYLNSISITLDPSEVDNYKDTVLIKYESGQVFLTEFIEWYMARKSYVKLNMSSPEGFFSSLEQKTWQMLRDKLLIYRAYQRGLHHREVVEIQQQWWEDKVVYSTVKAEIANTIEIDEKELLDYYNSNKQSYQYGSGAIIPFEKAKNNVHSDYLKQEYMAKMYRRIQELKQKYKITINHDVLNNLAMEAENDPQAIDVYTVKTGGTLPRQSFPTIDWDWQAWF